MLSKENLAELPARGYVRSIFTTGTRAWREVFAARAKCGAGSLGQKAPSVIVLPSRVGDIAQRTWHPARSDSPLRRKAHATFSQPGHESPLLPRDCDFRHVLGH